MPIPMPAFAPELSPPAEEGLGVAAEDVEAGTFTDATAESAVPAARDALDTTDVDLTGVYSGAAFNSFGPLAWNVSCPGSAQFAF